MAYKTDYNRVHGLGAAGEGAHHWWMQRLTSIALIPLTLLFLFPFGAALGQGYEAVIEIYRNWWNALIAVAFLIVGFWHLMQGLQVVIEDYVPSKGLRTVLLLANTLLNWALGAAGVFAVASIAFSG
jgi:succinate dehydrogenase / fumarate reductase membrane anchor subunit